MKMTNEQMWEKVGKLFNKKRDKPITAKDLAAYVKVSTRHALLVLKSFADDRKLKVTDAGLPGRGRPPLAFLRV